MIFEIMAPQL